MKGRDDMGIYLNPGNALFSKTLKSQIYIDKSELIEILNKKQEQENNMFVDHGLEDLEKVLMRICQLHIIQKNVTHMNYLMI